MIPDGGYWLGAVWAMTNYSVLRGLTNVGADSLAYEIAVNHLNNVTRIFNKTGIIWENYSPEFLKGSGRENFVGEGGLTGTAILLEYIFGIRSDVPDQTIVWDIRLTDEFGVNQYPFGKKGIINLSCHKRKNATDEPFIKVNSNVAFRLKLIWGGGSKTLDVKAQNLNTELTIEIIQKGLQNKTAAWVQIQTEGNDNFGGWYGTVGPKGFPAYSPVKVKVPVGIITITAWNSNCDEVSTKLFDQE